MRKSFKSTKFIVLMGLFIGMSVVGGYIKIPNPITTSIALDSFPAFSAALILGGAPAALIACMGTLLSAAIGGFSMTLPIHLFIAAQMAVIMFLYKLSVDRFGQRIGGILGVVLNGVIAPACFILIPGYGWEVFVSLLLPLIIASVVNVGASIVVTNALKKTDFLKNYLEN